MIFNVVTSIQAEEDLRGIFEYIAFINVNIILYKNDHL